jgi:hypothetical protein
MEVNELDRVSVHGFSLGTTTDDDALEVGGSLTVVVSESR